MTASFAASHSKGKAAVDKIFGANAACLQAEAIHGKDKVTNATIGAIMDDQGNLACIPTVERVLKELPMPEIANYAPVAGLPKYLKAVIDLTFADQKPDAYISAIATAGGTGAIHHTIWNYSEVGDTILTSDWFWGPYNMLATESMRKLDTYALFDENHQFNIAAFQAKTDALLAKQESLVVIINTPAHNPTGYSLTDAEWAQVLDVCKGYDKSKRITLMVDVAYLDYAGEKNACRSFMKQFSRLPDNILVILGFSMSKGYTMYGQRTGAMIGVSSNKDVIDEFTEINKYSSRATWSNVNRGAMNVLVAIHEDKALLAQFEKEREALYQTIRSRADLFMREAQECGLRMLPYIAGFFLSIPADDPDAVCERMHDDLIFAVPLKKGVRIAVCSVPTLKIAGMAANVLRAMK